MDNWIIITWFVSGIIYVYINGRFRKLYTEDDWLLSTVHALLGPPFIVLRLFILGKDYVNKKKKTKTDGISGEQTELR